MKKLLFIGMLSMSSATFAACPAITTIFACTTTNHKVVNVCDMDGSIKYTFGKPAQNPELTLSVPNAKLSAYLAPAGFSLEIPHGNTVYEASWGYSRRSVNPIPEAALTVYVNKKQVAMLNCSNAYPIIGDINKIDQMSLKEPD